MMRTLITILAYISLLLLLSACGGGGGGTSGGSTNHAPVLSALSGVNMVAGTSRTLTLTASDPDNDPVSFTVSGGSAATIAATITGNVLTLTPAPGYVTSSPLALTVTASDGKGGTNAKTFSVTVAAPSRVIVTLATSGTVLQGSSIGGIGATVLYAPAQGLTITQTNVAASGRAQGSTLVPNLSVVNQVGLGIISAAGFGIGEFATLTFDVESGKVPTAGDFSVKPGSTVYASDTNATDISSQVSVSISGVTFQ